MQELKETFAEWKNFIHTRETARLEAMSTQDDSLKIEIAYKKQQLAMMRAEIQQLEAQQVLQKSTYSRSAFDAEWSVKKKDLKQKLDLLIKEQFINGKTPFQLGKDIGVTSLNLFYEARKGLDVYEQEQKEKLDSYDWKWSRFTGTRRYALAAEDGGNWTHVLMKGSVDTPEEGKSCIWDFVTGALLQGSPEVYHSDSEKNRRNRADTLASILEGTYTGKVRETPNEYFEEVEGEDQ